MKTLLYEFSSSSLRKLVRLNLRKVEKTQCNVSGTLSNSNYKGSDKDLDR